VKIEEKEASLSYSKNGRQKKCRPILVKEAEGSTWEPRGIRGIVLICSLSKLDEVWTGLIWHRIETSDGFPIHRYTFLSFHKIRRISSTYYY